MGTIADRLLETDLRRIQLTIWPFATRCRYRVKASTGAGRLSLLQPPRSSGPGRPGLAEELSMETIASR